MLTKLIEEFLGEPRAIKVERLSFKYKVELALAVGVLIEELRRPLMELNGLRNKLAHDVEATISAEDQDRIFKSFTRETRAIIVGRRLSDSISYLHGRLTGSLHYTKEANKRSAVRNARCAQSGTPVSRQRLVATTVEFDWPANSWAP